MTSPLSSPAGLPERLRFADLVGHLSGQVEQVQIRKQYGYSAFRDCVKHKVGQLSFIWIKTGIFTFFPSPCA